MVAIPNFNFLFRLDGKIALSTGDSRGIRLYIPVAFLQAGALKVVMTARKEAMLKEAVGQLNAISGASSRASYIVAHLGGIDGIETQVQYLKRELPGGKLHILVNNTGAS